jgi:prepilin-type N-terminal cleavage/methylation domain-containing protein
LPRRRNAPAQGGYTLIELAVVIAVIAILATAAGVSFARSKARANLASSAAELQSLLHQARQSALATGTPVAVLVYPGYVPPAGPARGTGYFIVYRDACFDFFNKGTTCGVSFDGYDPAKPAAGGASEVLDTMTLPLGIAVGPDTGMGASATLKAPLQGIAVNVRCSFCGTTGGAVQFDPRGQATFFALSGTTVTRQDPGAGASLSLGYDAAVTDATGQRTLVILSGSGAVQALTAG